MKAWTRRALIVVIVLMFVGSALQSVALAASTYKAKTTCKLYSKISKKAKTRKVTKGRSVVVYGVKGKWCKVSVSGVKGYMLKASLTRPVKAKTATVRTLKYGDSGSAVKKLQSQLARRGFISSKSVGGRYAGTTAKAIRQSSTNR